MASTTPKAETPAKPDWYVESLDATAGWKATHDLLLKYTDIAEDKLAEHVYGIRARAWNHFPYPCIGTFHFLDLHIAQFPQYTEILDRVKAGQKLLDIGCCFAQDERCLIADGAPSENLYACDISSEFLGLGYDLFLDKDTNRMHFFTADIFDSSNANLIALDGEIDIINASAFFHLFEYEKQKNVAKRVTKLLKKKKGSLIVGRQVGNPNPGHYEDEVGKGGHVFRHNQFSWEKMWKEVEEETGVRFVVESILQKREKVFDKGSLGKAGSEMMKYSVRML